MSTIRAKVNLDGRIRDVEVRRRGTEAVARVGGREYKLTILEPRPGVYSFVPSATGGRSVELVVGEQDGSYAVRTGGRSYAANIEGPGRRERGADSGEGERVLRAQMPGRVVRVLVQAGASVKRGQGIVVIEAMKMENEIGSPKNGTVKDVRVAPDDRVEAGAHLATIA